MTDNQLTTLIRAQILAGLSRQGLSSVLVAGAYQPTTEGRTSEATVYFFPLTDNRYGWQGKKSAYNNLTGVTTIAETQIIESTFQIYALAPQDPTNLNLPTAKDLVNTVAMICNSQAFVSAMSKGGAGVQRVTQVRSPFFVNDQGNFEQSPSFDITITHKRQILEATRTAEEVTHAIHRV